MKAHEAISAVLKNLEGAEFIVSANGFISRELHEQADSPRNFYMLGSMGMAASIGAGVALNSDKKVVVLDGDGNLLMNLGALTAIGSAKPKKFVHIIIDNGVYESTGGQRTVSKGAELEKIATAAGYESSVKVHTTDELAKELGKEHSGPSFIRVMVGRGKREVGRIIPMPVELAKRARKYLSLS